MSVSKRRIPPVVWNIQKRVLATFTAIVFVAALVVAVVPSKPAYAAQITDRKLTLKSGSVDSDGDGVNDGGSMPGGVVNHEFTFTPPTTGTQIGSIKFEYCTVASVEACVAPENMSTSTPGATLGASTGIVFDSITNTGTNVSVVSRSTTIAPDGTTPVVVQLNSVKNPDVTSTPNYTFFVRITTHESLDGSGPAVDSGSVAASTSTQIELSGTMPESLIFCTGATISTTSSIPDCTTATAGSVTFDQLFSPTDTATATSQMAASTNASQGYAITVNGPTLTSGSNTIPAIDPTASASTVGTGQFGMNLIANTIMNNATTPAPLGTDPAPAANTTNFKGVPKTGFNTADTFKFDPAAANVVVASDDGGAGPTDAQIFTASYIVNVSGSQPAGTYTTTLTYICTATF